MVEAFFGQAFLSIQARIMAEVPAVKWVDQDMGQLEHYETRPAVQFPCVLIDFINAGYKEEGQLVQWGDITVQLRIGFAPFSSANSAAPVSAQEAALQYYDIENDIFKALHGWTPVYGDPQVPIADPLIRVTAATEQREDAHRVRVNHFTTAFEDDGATPTRTTVKAKMNIER